MTTIETLFFALYLEKVDATKAFIIIAAIMYGLAFILLAAAQFTKKEIFAKAIPPVFFFISKLNIAFRSFFVPVAVIIREELCVKLGEISFFQSIFIDGRNIGTWTVVAIFSFSPLCEK